MWDALSILCHEEQLISIVLEIDDVWLDVESLDQSPLMRSLLHLGAQDLCELACLSVAR